MILTVYVCENETPYVFCLGLFQKVKNRKNEVGGIMCQCNFSNVTSIGPQVPSRFALSKSVNLKNWQIIKTATTKQNKNECEKYNW